MRSLIYKAKAALHNNAAAYEKIYNLVTYNKDYAAQRAERDKYISKFGGMWTDRADFEQKLAAKKDLSEIQIQQLHDWHDNGIVTLSRAIDSDVIDRYLSETETLGRLSPSPLRMTSAALDVPTLFEPDQFLQTPSVRLVDDYMFSPASREILFNSQILNFLKLIFERDILLTQSLRFNQGSQQPIHQDTAFVRMNSPMKLVGVWTALEDIKPGTGELLYLPGSHKWEGYLFSGRFKHYDEERDGKDQLDSWHQWILDEADRRGVAPQSFHAKKGDVLFWHAALAHGGAAIIHPNSTRLSLVGHYCPRGVRPLYHYYKPAQRKIYREGSNLYTTSYYNQAEIKRRPS